MRKHLRVGYISSFAAAPLLVASELQPCVEAGFNLVPSLEIGWAPIRQKLMMGQLDGAVVPATFPFTLEGGVEGDLDIKVVAAMGFGGRRVVVSEEFLRCLEARSCSDSIRYATSGPLTADLFYIEQCLQSLGLADWCLRLKSVPVAVTQYVHYLGHGSIDICVTVEPWASWVESRGFGRALSCGSSFERTDLSRVLVIKSDWLTLNPGAESVLLKRLTDAAMWANDAANAPQLIPLFRKDGWELSDREMLDLMNRRVTLGGPAAFCPVRPGMRDIRVNAADVEVAWRAFSCSQKREGERIPAGLSRVFGF